MTSEGHAAPPARPASPQMWLPFDALTWAAPDASCPDAPAVPAPPAPPARTRRRESRAERRARRRPRLLRLQAFRARQLELVLPGPGETLPPRRPNPRADLGGPDLARPCEGCPRRARCRAPCELLAGALPPEEICQWNEVGILPFVEDSGRIEALAVLHPAAQRPEPALVWPRIVAAYGPKLREAIERLPTPQRLLLRGMLEGHDRGDLVRARSVSRQAIHKTFWVAIRTLRAQLGPLPPRLTPDGPRRRRARLLAAANTEA